MIHNRVVRRAVVFANGELHQWPEAFKMDSERDLVIASDGGYRHCRFWNIRPHLVVGDLDSIGEADLAGLTADGVEVLKYSPQKDETDLQLAMRTAMDRGATEIVVLGALGARWDMTFANVLMLGASFLDEMNVTFLEEWEEIHRLRGGQKVSFTGRAGNILTLIPLTERVEGIRLGGLRYPLENETLYMGSTRGVSNEFIGETADIQFNEGRLLVVINKKGV